MAADERTKGKDERSKVRLDDFTTKVVPDPKNPAEVLFITGFVGASSEPEHTRIYWDPSLSAYIDAETADILHSEPLPKEQSPLGGSHIWLKRGAKVFFGSAGGQSTKGKFFEGPLMAAYGGQFGAAGAAGTAAGPNILFTFYHCPPTLHCTLPIACPPSPHHPCISPYCTLYVGCPGLGAMPAQGPGGEAAAAAPQFIPSLVCSYAEGCWFSWNACPTLGWCGGHGSRPCPPLPQAAAAPELGMPQIAGSYAPGCWYSWNACPTLGWCGGHGSRPCPPLPQEAAYGGGAAPQFPSRSIECPWTAGCSFASCGHHCTI